MNAIPRSGMRAHSEPCFYMKGTNESRNIDKQRLSALHIREYTHPNAILWEALNGCEPSSSEGGFAAPWHIAD